MRILVAYVRVLFLFFIYAYRLRVAHDERGTVLSTFFFFFFFSRSLIFITIRLCVYKTITHLRASQSLKVNELDNNIIYIYIFVFLSSTECPLQRFNHGFSSSSRAEGLSDESSRRQRSPLEDML